MKFSLETDIIKVPENKNYWFVRTYSGEAYSFYRKGNYIGLGLNNVPYNYIKQASFKDLVTYTSLKTFISNNTQYKKAEATKITNQLISFSHEMKTGDVVIIPSKNSEQYSIGTIESDVFLVEKPGIIEVRDKKQELPEKRRTVKWKKVVDKDEIQADLRGLVSSHHGLTNGNEYSEIIEGYLSSMFTKNNHAYLVIEVGQNEDINAFDLKRFLDSITFFYNEFCKEAGEPLNEDLTIKIKLQSKGKLALKALSISGIIGIGTLVALSNNNELDIDLTTLKIKAKSDGYLKSRSDDKDAEQKRLDTEQRRKEQLIIFQDSMHRLEANRNDNDGLDKPLPDEAKKSREQNKRDNPSNK